MSKKPYTTTLKNQSIKKLKILAVNQEKYENELIEEALELLHEKYSKKQTESTT